MIFNMLFIIMLNLLYKEIDEFEAYIMYVIISVKGYHL